MAKESTSKRAYPWTTTIKNGQVTLRLMSPQDGKTMLAFTQSLPEEDLVFLTVDITQPGIVERWANSLQSERMKVVVAEVNGQVVAYGSLTRNEPFWTRHLGEIQIMIVPEYRGRGLGHILANEVHALAQDSGLQKIIARMAADQRSAVQVFETMGFRVEALLADYVMDRAGKTHDLIVMSYDVTGLTE
ncbi:MAG: GNAT family N-acetyltransferase [Acidobacteria bacterium]|nr:GNAT family N-acetyltransferase [Acidobacteriota bacterium]